MHFLMKGRVLYVKLSLNEYRMFFYLMWVNRFFKYFLLFKKKYPVDFDDELKIGDVWYDDMT